MLTAAESRGAIADYVKSINVRHTPRRPKIYEKVSKENTVYIFNVGPWMHKRETGSTGTFFIPACPAGKPYSEPLAIEGILEEPYPDNEVAMKMLEPQDGQFFANQIIGKGPHSTPGMNLEAFGVFISVDKTPSKGQIAEALARLQIKFQELVREMNASWDRDRDKGKVFQDEWHRVAALALKKTNTECPWLTDTTQAANREECAGCGETYKVGIMKCRSCGFILDRPRYEQAKKDGLFAA